MNTVRDIMQTEVVTVSPGTSVREVAQTLARRSIGGAPVVDDDGRVVGVVSATDIVRAAARDPEVEFGFEVERDPSEDVDESVDEVDPVSDFHVSEELPAWFRPVMLGDELADLDAASIMTPATFSVGPDADVRELAEFLVRGRIHRALVLEDGQLVGIVTSFDALRALAGMVGLTEAVG